MQDVLLARRTNPVVLTNSPTSAQCHDCDARHLGMCDALSDGDMGSLARVAQRMNVPAGKAFIEEGADARYFYDVSHGDVRVFKSLADGRRQVTGFMGAGHFLGLALHGKYAFSAEAMNDVQLCRFDRAALQKVFQEFPALERKLLDVATHELVVAQEQMLLLGRKTALERVASFLMAWAERLDLHVSGARLAAAFTMALPMNRTDLADYLGLTIESVSRAFSRLKQDGLIAFSHSHEVRILKPQKLIKMTNGDDDAQWSRA
jgi:CRP/FNR family transcriptional regulator